MKHWEYFKDRVYLREGTVTGYRIVSNPSATAYPQTFFIQDRQEVAERITELLQGYEEKVQGKYNE